MTAAAGEPRAAQAAANARGGVGSFLLIAIQLVLLERALTWLAIESRTLRFVARAAFGAFALHWWLPLRWREPALVLISLALPPILFQPKTGFGLLAFGALLFCACVAPGPYRLRAGLGVGLLAVALGVRLGALLDLPEQLWPLIGGVFGLRTFGYLYDLRRLERVDPVAFGAFFFQLPNYAFLFFPVVDYETMRATRYRRPAGVVAQEGVAWMTRGVVQILVYRLLYHDALPASTPEAIDSPWRLLQVVVVTYLLYLRLSGTFHLAIGMMKLFGYDLPETHRRYLLASSLTDFWRRINIYWKDLMVKLVYFPVVFRLRRAATGRDASARARNELRAALLGTACVFFVTWIAHAYVKLWWNPAWPFTGPDALFWFGLGALVAVNVVAEDRRARRRTPRGALSALQGSAAGTKAPLLARANHAVGVLATFSLIAFLWYLWQRPTLAEWWELVTWWSLG